MSIREPQSFKRPFQRNAHARAAAQSSPAPGRIRRLHAVGSIARAASTPDLEPHDLEPHDLEPHDLEPHDLEPQMRDAA